MPVKHLIAEYKIKSGTEEQALEAITAFVQAVHEKEPYVLKYDAYQKPDGVSFIHFMSFEDEEGEEKHKTVEHTLKFVEILYPLCEVEPVFTELTAIEK